MNSMKLSQQDEFGANSFNLQQMIQSQFEWPSGFASLATTERNEFVVCVCIQVC